MQPCPQGADERSFRAGGPPYVPQRHAVKLLHAQNLLSVSGPPIYLDQLRGAMKAFEDAQGSRSVMRVFPLKYAWAEDMKVNSMDSNGTPLTGSQVTVQPSAQGGLRGKGLIAMNASTDTSQASPAVPQNGKDQSGTTAGPSIIADPRVNAVVVTDAEYRMSYYGQACGACGDPCGHRGYRQRFLP